VRIGLRMLLVQLSWLEADDNHQTETVEIVVRIVVTWHMIQPRPRTSAIHVEGKPGHP